MIKKKSTDESTSKTRQDLFAAERQRMFTKYDELVKPTQRLLREYENAILLPSLINAGRKRIRTRKDEEVKITLKLWLESMELRGSRISGAVLKEKQKISEAT
ncbi:hypothetical protein MXB_4506 [Myxobolus squamalis]|nr:hypothetical protein MXB_4506 [Myxobolus squamalis]